MLILSDASSLCELFGQVCISECGIFLLFLVLARNGSIPGIFSNVVFFLHELDEIGGVSVCLELLKHLVERRLVLIDTVIVIHTHFKLHL